MAGAGGWGAFAGSVTLSRRIVASVALGLALVLLLFSLVALWTIQESTRAAYADRVELARFMARHVDHLLLSTLDLLEREAIGLGPALRAEGSMRVSQQDRLADLRLSVGGFAILSVTDATGTTVWTEPSQWGVVLGSPLQHPGVQLVLATGRPQITEFFSPTEGGRLLPCLAVPLWDEEGQVAGSLMAELDLDREGLGLLPHGMDTAGMRMRLLHQSGQEVGHDGSRGPDFSHEPLLRDLIQSGESGYRLHRPNGAGSFPVHLVAYAPLETLPSMGVLVEQPRDVVVAVPNRLRLRLALLGLGVLVLSATVAWLDVRRVVGPLNELTQAARRFAAGQLDEPVTLERADELGVLASAFETMRQRLRRSLEEVAAWNRELEARVEARTAEVEARNRELARLYDSLRERERERAELLQRVMAGQEEERRRLAQELHDEASQLLASLQIGLERLGQAEQGAEGMRDLVRELQEIAGQTLAAVHRLAVELRPSVLDDAGLVAAVELCLQESTRRWGLRVDFAQVGLDGVRLIPAAETAVYRIVQAAVTNAAQHARAQHLSLLMERRDEKLVVAVEDDGCGFDLEAVRAAPLEQRLGLAGMEERAALIGASLTIETRPGGGTTVFLEVPLGLNKRREEER